MMPWAEVFDLLSCEYGWKTEYIINTSLREIKWRIKEIGKRQNKDREFFMQINGIPVKKVQTEKKQIELTEDQKKAMDIALQRAKERKAREYGRFISN